MLWSSSLVVVAIMALAWGVQCRTRNAGWVDALWALCISGCAFAYALLLEGDVALKWMAAGIMGLWYLRLGSFLVYRLWGEAEEGRYAYLRQHWGGSAIWHFGWFYLLQALLAVGFSLPAFVIASGSFDAWQWHHIAGITLAVVSLCGVILADHQLQQFRANPAHKGQVCEQGLWQFSRHPNYFFEWLHWWSYPLIAIGLPHAGWLWFFPLLMGGFLYAVTGIPYTEQQAIRSRGEAYRRYQETTSAFFPWRKLK